MTQVRRFVYAGNIEYIENNQGRVEFREQEAQFQIEMVSSDITNVDYTRDFEYIPKAFDISAGVTVPAGGYTYNNLLSSYYLGSQHRLSGTVSYQDGQLYGGTDGGAGISAEVSGVVGRPSLAELVDLPWVISTTVVTDRSRSPSSRMFGVRGHTLKTGAQHECFRWEYQPAASCSSCATAATQSYRLPDGRESALIVKITKLFRLQSCRFEATLLLYSADDLEPADAGHRGGQAPCQHGAANLTLILLAVRLVVRASALLRACALAQAPWRIAAGGIARMSARSIGRLSTRVGLSDALLEHGSPARWHDSVQRRLGCISASRRVRAAMLESRPNTRRRIRRPVPFGYGAGPHRNLPESTYAPSFQPVTRRSRAVAVQPSAHQRNAHIYCIDTEGGQATLLCRPRVRPCWWTPGTLERVTRSASWKP
jgi:hypothetical protein